MCIICDHTEIYNKVKRNISLDEYLRNKLKRYKTLSCYDCQLIEKVPNIAGLVCLNCINCTQLKEVPTIVGLKYLYCSNCRLIEKVPNIISLVELDIWGCQLIKNMPNLPNLQKLYCGHCILLKEIPYMNDLWFLSCIGCEQLRIIDTQTIDVLYSNQCPKLFYSQEHIENKTKINKLRNFIRNNYRYFLFKHWIKSREFCEHYYSPENRVGDMEKINLERFVTSI
jgi:hypothetical protein